MSLIHPTAIIHPEAKLGENVRVGPYAVIEGPAEIGDHCVIHGHVTITGYVTMGAHNTIGHGSVIGGDPQDLAFDPATESRVVIGERNRIREHATIHRGTAAGSVTRVGNDCFFMAGTHLAHNVTVADKVVIANNALLGGHVEVQESVFIGGGSVFHQFVRIGRNVIIQGISGMGKDVPPFLIGCRVNRVSGLNAIGLRRSGLDAAEREEIKSAFKLLYKSNLNVSQALEAAKEQTWGPHGTAFFEFVAASKKRGICDLADSRRGEAPEE